MLCSSYVQLLAIAGVASPLEPLSSSAASPSAAFVGTLLRLSRRHSAPTSRCTGSGMMTLCKLRQAAIEMADNGSMGSATKPIKPSLALLHKGISSPEVHETLLQTTSTSASQAVNTLMTSVEANLALDNQASVALSTKATRMPEADQQLLLTTAATATALTIGWFSAAGGEYWTAASRAALVAMLRTIGADYVTQLGKHKLSHEDGKAGNAAEKLPLADEFQPDLNRTCSMGMFYALYYIGPFSYVLTELYPRLFGNDGSWQEVMTKVLVENVLWMPIGYWLLWSMFKVGIDSYLQRGQGAAATGDSGNPFENLARAVWRDITTDFWKKNLVCFSFWCPADIFNFKFVPQYVVPTAMVVEGAIWAAILGTIEYDQKNKTGADE